MDGPNPTESKIARDEGFIIRTRMNTVNGHSDQRDQAKGSDQRNHLHYLKFEGRINAK